MKYCPDDYLEYDPFEGDQDVDIRCRTVKLVRTRTAHNCSSPGPADHVIEPGSLARYEKAFVDGSHWGSYYTCTDCLDKWLDELNHGHYGDDIDDELAVPEPPYRCDRTRDIFGGVV